MKTYSPLIKKQKSNTLVNLYWSASAVLAAGATAVSTAFAANPDMWDKLRTMFGGVYDKIVGISTIVAVVMAAIALIIRMVSKNQRTVDEATQWLKRIVITWIILNSIAFIIPYLTELTDGGKWDWKNG